MTNTAGPHLRIRRARLVPFGGTRRTLVPQLRHRLQDATAHATPSSGRAIVHVVTFDSAPPHTDTLPLTKVGLRENSIVLRATRFSSTKSSWQLRDLDSLVSSPYGSQFGLSE
jgi:hypothetical protein